MQWKELIVSSVCTEMHTEATRGSAKGERECAATKGCTFTPHINKRAENSSSRQFRPYERSKTKNYDELQRKKVEREMAECTFTPNMGKRSPMKSPQDAHKCFDRLHQSKSKTKQRNDELRKQAEDRELAE